MIYTKEQLEEKLVIGAKIKFGKKYAKDHNSSEGKVIELIEGTFECDNGLYTYYESCPAIWNEKTKDFDSIYHLFGNDFEWFMDCKILTKET